MTKLNSSNELKILTASADDRDFIDDKIVEFNSKQVPFTQAEQFTRIDYVIKNQNIIIGGITSILYCWKCLYIDVLWVDEKYRMNGLGSQLILKVEERAKELGCTLAHLDTFDFQAKDFYIKHGYEVFGVLDNCPQGHKRYYMKKNF